MSGSRPDQDLVRHAYDVYADTQISIHYLARTGHSSFAANKAKAEADTRNLYSGTVILSGENNLSLSQVITGGIF